MGVKIHVLVDQQGPPLSIHVTGANQHDKWAVTALVLSILIKRPTTQHFCAVKAYDSWDVHVFVKQQGYIPHIKHRRRPNEPKEEACPIPGEHRYPARRWVVERTLSWLTKRRSIRTRWCKKPENWLSLIQLACADTVFNLAFYG